MLERGRLVRIRSRRVIPDIEDRQRFFALRAQCGRDVRVPIDRLSHANAGRGRLNDFLGKACL